MRCPCRKKSETVAYEACCGPYHAGLRHAPTPEALMRSRYAAFVMENMAYLGDTWHPTTRPSGLALTPGQEWLLLRIVASRTEGDRGTVEFVARSRIGRDLHVLHELSRFVRENGRWLYVDGDIK